MNIQVQWEFDLPYDATHGAHDKFAADNGIPLEVDLNDYFHNPKEVNEFQITDSLSDEHGWLIKSWKVIDSGS